jgi:hypothetical protein
VSYNYTKIAVFTTEGREPFHITYDKDEFEAFEKALLNDKNAEWLEGYLFNIKNVVAIKRV